MDELTEAQKELIKGDRQRQIERQEQQEKCFECEDAEKLKNLTKEELCKELQNYSRFRMGVKHYYD